MMRTIGAIAAGLAIWILVATLGDLLLRLAWPAYAAVEKAMAFTLGMLLARLVLGALASLCAGFGTAWLSRRKPLAAWSLVVLLLALFIPVHYNLWHRFPVWYHLVFIASLVIFTLLGAMRRLPR
jgi:hypothetical protein